jgi:glycosyltransferase involved in cell wall biosynthesis
MSDFKVSVLITTHNSERFIRAALSSVASQTLQPYEIIICNDAGSDGTVGILNEFAAKMNSNALISGSTSRVQVVALKTNVGVAMARKLLVGLAQGTHIAFLDHDDVWHPEYLRAHFFNYVAFPSVVGSFIGHETFSGGTDELFKDSMLGYPRIVCTREFVSPSGFIREYHNAIGPYVSPSFFCGPSHILKSISVPTDKVGFADDSYIFHVLPLKGPIALDRTQLGAYRLAPGSQATNSLRCVELVLACLDLLKDDYLASNNEELIKAYRWSCSMERRTIGRMLVGIGKGKAGRQQLLKSVLDDPTDLVSVGKGLRRFAQSLLPVQIQPKWPSAVRRT